MTKIVFIASALFLLSIIYKNNLEPDEQTTKPQVADSSFLSDKMAGLATDLNELLSSEQTSAGQTTNPQDPSKTAKLGLKQELGVKEDLVNAPKNGFADDRDGKLASVLAAITNQESTSDVPSKNTPVSVLPAAAAVAAVPLVSESGKGSRQLSETTNTSTTSRELVNNPSQTSAQTSSNTAVPVVAIPLNSQSEEALSKVTEQSGKYYVQYGIFSSACRSEQVKDKLSQAGIYSVMDKLDPEGEQWIVKSKPYASRVEATYNLQAAQRKGYESYLISAK